MKNGEIVYSLSVEDIQETALQELERRLSPKEVQKVADEIGNYIDWYQAIALAIERTGVGATDRS
ncbi:MAG: hypothetical protein Q8O25_03815 [Sulfurisoma sp.]|nr:hypothetical protein [Sulfurisoma sp.]